MTGWKEVDVCYCVVKELELIVNILTLLNISKLICKLCSFRIIEDKAF